MTTTEELYASMDDMSEHAITINPIRDGMSEDAIDASNEEAAERERIELLDDVRHGMRTAWRIALEGGILTPRRLPIVEDGRVLEISLPELLARLMDAARFPVLLADLLRGSSPDAMHAALRAEYVDDYSAALAALNWSI